MSDRRQRAERSGRRGERIAAWWLRLKGWRILAMRARTPVGEVDLVARRGHMLAFVEVKRGHVEGAALSPTMAAAPGAKRQRRWPRVCAPGDAIRIERY